MASKGKNLRDLQERPINDLIIFALLGIESRGEVASFEKIVKECFSLFPQVFYLKGFAKWPDSRKLDRPLRNFTL